MIMIIVIVNMLVMMLGSSIHKFDESFQVLGSPMPPNFVGCFSFGNLPSSRACRPRLLFHGQGHDIFIVIATSVGTAIVLMMIIIGGTVPTTTTLTLMVLLLIMIIPVSVTKHSALPER